MDREELVSTYYDGDPRATLGVRPGGSRPGMLPPLRQQGGLDDGHGGYRGQWGHRRQGSLGSQWSHGSHESHGSHDGRLGVGPSSTGMSGPSASASAGMPSSSILVPGSTFAPGSTSASPSPSASGRRAPPPKLPPLQLQLTQSHGSASSSRPPSPKNMSPTPYLSRARVSLAVPPGRGDRSTSGATNVTAPSALTSSVNSNANSMTTEGIKRRRRPTMRRRHRASGLAENSREHEAQKMLGHLLDCLESRRKGPDILSRAAAAAKDTSAAQTRRKTSVAHLGKVVAAATVRTTAAAAKAVTRNEDDGDDLDEDMAAAEEGSWDTNATYDLLEKTRSLFILADANGFDLFSASGIAAADAASKAAKLKSKNRAGRFPSISGAMSSSANANPNKDKDNDDSVFGGVPGPTLMKRLGAVVHSLVATDCLYTTTRFRLLRPPYALQTMVLDIAALLYHKGDLEIKLMMMNAVIEALYTMGAPMRDRICQWLEGRMGELLRQLASERGATDDDAKSDKVDWNDPFSPDASAESPVVPTFAFSAPEDSQRTPPTGNRGDRGWMRFSPVGTPTFQWPDKIVGVLSTHAAANVSTAAIQIASLVPRMLVAITSTIDLTTSNLITVHCVHRLISLVLTAKPDAGLDLLEIIAHGPPVARRRGMDILATYYAKTVGHNVIARRPALTTYAAHRTKWETGQDRALLEDDTEGHYWMPWRANGKTDMCVACEQVCLGFGVRCALCGDIKHFYCLKLIHQEVFEYTTTILATHSTPSRGEMVSVRFSPVPPRPDELVINGGVTKGTPEATQRKVGQHHLHLVNLFTLTLCDECKQPLWGTMAQAYACFNQCQRFFHPACVDAMALYSNPVCQPGRQVYVNPEASEAGEVLDPFTTTAVGIHESFLQYKNKLCYDPSKLGDMSYDEVSYLYANIWLQHEIYLNGISVGSLRLVDVPLEDDITGIALLLNQYEVKLDRQLSPSPAMIDFANVSSKEIPDKGCLLWQVRYLQYCAALIRAPPDQPPDPDQSADGLLTVATSIPGSPDPSVSGVVEAPAVAYEQVPIRVVQQCLASDLYLRDDLAASTLIEQLRQLGLVSVPNRRAIDVAAIDDKTMEITTPLPLLMDSSPAVELLVLAIEGLLEDIDLTANEQALSMLVKLAWPTTMCSPYAMVRLGGAVMSWIMDEDDVLHNIVKSYASMRKRPPGVRNPPGHTGEGSSAVAAYKDDRGRLLVRYARPWLEALCALDPQAYTDLAYERAKIIDNRYEALDLPKGAEAAAHMAGIALERITALADADVMFCGTMDLLTNWIEDLGAVLDSNVVFKQLPRLLRHANSRSDFERDIWDEAHAVSEEGDEGFARVCRWLRALTFSGVVVPWDVIITLVDKHAVGRSADEALYNLVVAVDANTATIEPQAFARLCNNMFIPLAVSMGLRPDKPTQQECDMLCISMLSLLKAYGTPPEAIAETSLASVGKAKGHAQNPRRRQSMAPVTLELHAEIIFAAARILPHKDRPANAVLDFLWLLSTKATAVNNVRGFLHHICPELYDILWRLYDRPEIDRRSRARVFLQLLTINNAPIQDLVVKETRGPQERATRERLLEFVLELADESVTSEVVGFRRASVGLIAVFFGQALQPYDPNPDTLVIWRALLPTQLQALTACFEEYLESCPDEQRLQLIVQLLRLRAHLPAWPIVGWGVIEQLVSEQLTTLLQFEGHDSVQALSAVAEARNIRAAILALGMHMLAAGVECEWATLQRFQQHVAAACAQPWPTPSDTVTGILLPALKTILDSTARTPVFDSAGGRAKETTLVGALFVSIVINFATDLGKYDFIVQRCILDILLVVFFKHNVQPYELSALSTLQTLASFAAEPNSSENRLLALQILRTAQSHMPKDRFSRVLPPLFVGVADIMFKETKAEGDSAIIDSCRELLQASIEEFGKAGLFLQVLRTDGQLSAGSCAPEAIGRAMQGAARLSGSKNKNVWLDQVILDLPDVLRWPRAGMAHVFQSIARLSATLEDGLSDDSAHEFGAFLSRLSKHAAEWDAPDDINLNPVLQTCTCLLKICPGPAELTLLHSISNFLHVILPRYSVHLEQIRKLIPVSIAKARRQQTENTVATVLFEGCGAAMKGLAVHPVTLQSLLDWMGDEDPHLQKERLSLIVEASQGCASILTRMHPTLTTIRDAELTMGVLKGAATVIVRAEIQSQGNTGRVLRNLPNEAAATTLDVFAHILYASLHVRLGAARSRLLSLYPVLGRATALSLFACADLLSIPDPHGEGAHIASAAFVIMRLAILAVNDPPPKEGGTFDESTVESQDVLQSFWHRLWPEWERLLSLSLAPSCINMPQRAVTLSVLMDVILFISANQPHLLVEQAPTLARGLATLEEWHHSAGTTTPAKLHKAAAALEAAALSSQPAANARRTAMRAVWADMLATERLLALRSHGGYDH